MAQEDFEAIRESMTEVMCKQLQTITVERDEAKNELASERSKREALTHELIQMRSESQALKGRISMLPNRTQLKLKS